jgi:hypothetical protein
MNDSDVLIPRSGYTYQPDYYVTVPPGALLDRSVIELAFGYYGDTSPQQAYDRAAAIDPAETAVVTAIETVMEPVRQAAGKAMQGISMVGAVLAAFIVMVVLLILKMR